MADSILRLRVQSDEYDNKLKRAAEGIRHLADVAHKSGGELTGLEKAELDYIKSLGDMETKSRTAAGSVRELENTFKELTVVYNQLNDVEKQDEGGKALAASLDQLKQRAQSARAELDNASKTLGEQKDAGQQTGGMLDGLAEKFGLSITKVMGFGTALAAGKVALDVAKDAFFASESNIDEWGRTVAASQSLYEGFLTAINNGDISGYLSNIDSIVKAARLAYDELDKLGTMKTIQAPQISKQQTENERIRSMIQTGRYIAPQDGRKNAVFNGREMQTGDKLTAGQIRYLEKQLQGGMQKVVKLVGNEVDQTGKAINAYYDKLAKTNGMSLQEFKKGTSSWAEFNKRMQGYEDYKKFENEHSSVRERYNPTTQEYESYIIRDQEKNPHQQYAKWGTFRVDKEGDNSYKDLVALIQQRDQQVGQVYSTQAQAYRTMNRAEGVTVRQIMGGTGGKGGTTTNPVDQAEKIVSDALFSYQQSVDKAKLEMESGLKTEADMKKALLSGQERLYDAYGKAYAIYADPKYKEEQDKAAAEIVKLGGEVKNATEAQKKAEQAARELEAAQKKLADAQRELATARDSGKLSDIYTAEKKVATAQGEVTRLESGQPLAIPDEKTVTIKANTENITAQIAHLKEQMGSLEIGSIDFNKTQDSLVDMNTLQSLINTQMKAGLKIDQTVTSDLMQQILGGQNIDDTTWQALVDEINQKLAELELPPIKLNFQTGDVAKDAKAAAKEWQAAGSAIQSVGSAMTQIEDPAAKVLGTVAQAIASVALAASQAMAAKDTTASGWAWIGAAAAITGTMISTIAAIKSATAGSYAEGGIIPGNKYSGDAQLAWVNAGELILNRSQTNNIANQLQGATLGNLHLSATVSGEQIRLVLNNNGKRTGRGEYLTTRFS